MAVKKAASRKRVVRMKPPTKWKANVALLRDVQGYMMKHPEDINQQAYCGSQFCIAGTAAVLAGLITRRAIKRLDELAAMIPGDGRISSAAQKALRLTNLEAGRLFDARWSHLPERYRPPSRYAYSDKDTEEFQKDCMLVSCDRIDLFIRTKGKM